MLKAPSTLKKKIKLTHPTQAQSTCNRLLNSSFQQPVHVTSSYNQSSSLFQQIKFTPYKVNSHQYDFDKLGQITDRCISYKQSFIDNYQQQMVIFEDILKIQKQYVYNSCEALIKRICQKRDKLIQQLIAKEYQIRLQWQGSLSDLQNHIESIKIANSQNIQLTSINRNQFDQKLGNFTNLVSTFYRKIRILQIRVAEDLDQTQFCQIKNEAKSISQLKIPHSNSILQNKSFTFNQISSHESMNCLQKLNDILSNQKQRDLNIESYKQNLR